MIAESKTLVDKKVFPAVSIILPVHPQFPEIKADSEKMISILKNAKKQLQSRFGKQTCELMMDKIEHVISKIPWRHLSKSLLIYVSPETEKFISLPFPVTEKVIVDSSFEVRDLLYATQKNDTYLVVIISQNQVKTFSFNQDALLSITFPGMPDNLKDVLNEHSYPGRDMLDTQAYEEKNIRNYLHFIDDVLEKELKLNDRPVIVMGDVKLLGYFREKTRNQKKIIGYVTGNYEHADAAEIKMKVAPVMEKISREHEEKALMKLKEAVNKNQYSAGITEVWRATAEGRGRLLLVEKDYHQSARLGDDEYTITPDDSGINPFNVHKDVVDDVIELVLKNNGEVLFLETHALTAFNHIALITRY